MHATECWPRETLKEYLSGWSDPDLANRIESHLAECTSCEQTVEDLEADPDTFLEVVRGIPSKTPAEQSLSADLAHPSTHHATIQAALSQARNLIDDSRLGEAISSAVPEPELGEFGAYELIRPLGHGGMGSVYLARHRQLGKQVAIKLLPSRAFRNDHYAARFQREVRAAGGLENSAIVNATDAGQHQGTHYLVMEYIDGLDLSRIARATGKFSIADACAVVRTAAQGLSHAHAVGIVHRDIKPSNLMLSTSGQTKILDFGLASHNLWDEASAENTTVGQLMGTLDYMAPEQAERADAVDYRADLYSLGATLFRLLCGHAPLAASPGLSPLAKLRLLATHESPSLATFRPDAPLALVKLVKSLLSRDPAERPASAAHVVEQLQPFTEGADLVALLNAARSRTQEETSLDLPAGVPVPLLSKSSDQNSSASGKSRGWWITTAAMVPLFALAGVLITLEFQKGQLVIDSDVANVSVSLLKDGEFYQQLQISPGANSTRLYAGKYQVEIEAGSDAILVDNGEYTIRRGETAIARVRNIAEPIENKQVVDTKLHADTPSKFADVEREILDLQVQEQLLLRKFGKGHPSVLAIRQKIGILQDYAARAREEVGGGTPLKSQAGNMPQADLEAPSEFVDNSPQNAGLLYGGQNLTGWLAILSRERSPVELNEAFAAVKALLQPDNRQIVSETLLRILPTISGRLQLKLPTGESTSTVDTRGFELLYSANPGDQYVAILVRELKKPDSTVSWKARLLFAGPTLLNEYDPSLLVDWLEPNVFKEVERHPLLTSATNLYVEYLNRQTPLEPQLEQRLLNTLEECSFLGQEFWLGQHLPATQDGTLALGSQIQRAGSQRFGRKYSEHVSAHALAALVSSDTSPQFVVQAIMILDEVRFSLKELLGEEGLAALHSALRNRLVTLATDEVQLYAVVQLSDSFRTQRLDGIHTWPSGYSVGVRTSDLKYASVTMELLHFTEHLGLSSQFESELSGLLTAVLPQVKEVYFSSRVANSGSNRSIALDWPALEAIDRSIPAAEVTPRQWLASFLWARISKMLPAETRAKFEADALAASQSEWMLMQFKEHDADGDNQLNPSEFDRFCEVYKSDLQFVKADTNSDGLVTIDELTHYKPDPNQVVESSSQIQWAMRQIGKYDSDGDGQLSVAECAKMIIKPTGADTDGDGFITAKEFANFRAR